MLFVGPLVNRGVPQPGPRHRGLGQALEEVCGEWDAGEGEVSTGVEEQVAAAEAVHDESAPARPHDIRHQVNTREDYFILVTRKFTQTIKHRATIE